MYIQGQRHRDQSCRRLHHRKTIRAVKRRNNYCKILGKYLWNSEMNCIKYLVLDQLNPDLLRCLSRRRDIYLVLPATKLTPQLKHLQSCRPASSSNDQIADIPANWDMLVILFLGLLAVALSFPNNLTTSLFDAVQGIKDGVIQINETFASYNTSDVNEDGLLTLKEFTAGAHPGAPPHKVENAFKFLDKLDGRQNDLVDLLSAVALLDGLDDNNVGEITVAESNGNYLLVFDDDNDDESEEVLTRLLSTISGRTGK